MFNLIIANDDVSLGAMASIKRDGNRIKGERMLISNIINLTFMDCSISDYLANPNRMNKIFIPGRFPGDAPQLVNRKQAHRILVMR